MRVSDCCGAAPRGNGDISFEDVGICSACYEHCEYAEEGEDEEVETPPSITFGGDCLD